MSKVLYPTSAGPVPTRLLGDYYPGDSSISLRTLRDVPPAPNLITLYSDDVFVTLLYTSVDDEHTLSGLSYIEGDDSVAFKESSYAVRTLNKYDVDAIQEYLASHEVSLADLLSALTAHVDDVSNPHDITKAQVGLGNADNTSDVNKPVSTAQRQAIDAVKTVVDNHIANKSNPHDVTKAQVGLGNADNTSDVNKPVSTAQRAAIDVVQDNLDDHEADTSNPHNVTKEQLGLGNVDNTSDANKPISNATQTALNGKLDDSQLVSTAPKSPAITASGGTSNSIPRVDHVHPSETFTLNDVVVTSWVASTDLPDYPYAATISNSNITSNHTPIVIFKSEDAMLNKFARVANSANGSVQIYARSIPSGNITIPTIILVRKI